MIRVRRFSPKDREVLRAAIDGVCAEGMMATPRFQPTPAWEHALSVPACPCHLLLVAEERGEIVGWCRLFPVPGDGCGPAMELGIGVRAEWRRQGLGRALLAEALRWAGRQGLPVVLQTRRENLPARRLFEESGFRPVGEEGGLLRMCRPIEEESR
ncbi:MAG: GNAT family N-acetyltransferase [Chloroflexia bacterium]